MVYESPRDRRLKSDLLALERLKLQSSIIDFKALDNPATHYVVTFQGKGIMQPPSSENVSLQTHHEVEIKLGVNYPRSKPDLKWRTPIFHPNISALGQVCLGGYSTHWVPSLNLDELCEMLWDMLRFANYDVKSPYNYKSARWVERQKQFTFPLDDRSLRDKVQAGLVVPADIEARTTPPQSPPKPAAPPPDVMFIEGDDSEAKAPEKPVDDAFYIGED